MENEITNRTIYTTFVASKKLQLALLALFCAGLVFGCAQIRKVTYPNDFVYLERKQIRSNMALLGFYMRQLNEIVPEASADGVNRQQEIIDLLHKIDAITIELGVGVTTNHLVIDDHIGEFSTEVKTAIQDARADPPNYYVVGRLTGSCIGCHQFRD